MEDPTELSAEIAAHMARWIADPVMRVRHVKDGHPLPPQVAARTMALAYVAGTTGGLSAAELARRLKMTPRQFSNYTGAARAEFGLRNPYFSGHSWNFGRKLLARHKSPSVAAGKK